MKEIKGFRPALQEFKGYAMEVESRFTRPEATAFAVKHALDQVFKEGIKTYGYETFMAERKRRMSLVETSSAMKSAKEKLK